jgi:hypothetical protein
MRAHVLGGWFTKDAAAVDAGGDLLHHMYSTAAVAEARNFMVRALCKYGKEVAGDLSFNAMCRLLHHYGGKQ